MLKPKKYTTIKHKVAESIKLRNTHEKKLQEIVSFKSKSLNFSTEQ